MTKVVGFFLGANGWCVFANPIPAVRYIFFRWHREYLNKLSMIALPPKKGCRFHQG